MDQAAFVQVRLWDPGLFVVDGHREVFAAPEMEVSAGVAFHGLPFGKTGAGVALQAAWLHYKSVVDSTVFPLNATPILAGHGPSLVHFSGPGKFHIMRALYDHLAAHILRAQGCNPAEAHRRNITVQVKAVDYDRRLLLELVTSPLRDGPVFVARRRLPRLQTAADVWW